MSARLLGAFALAIASSCADLPAIQAGTCGNFVVERGEDCDGVAPQGSRCRKPEEGDACRFDCANAKCPSGWLCSPTDGTCRAPSGNFDANATQLETSSGKILLGDVDGNGVEEIVTFSASDLAGRTTPRVFYFDELTNGPSKVLPVRAPTIAPELRDVSGDGVKDLVFSSLDGLNVMVGASDRTLTPIAFSRFAFPKGSVTRLARVRGLSSTPTGEGPAVFANPPGTRFIAGVNGIGDPNLKMVAVLEKSPLEMLGAPFAADVIEGTTSRCEELIWVWKGSDSISYANACSAKGTWPEGPDPAPHQLLTVPGDTIDAGVLPADLNGDGHVDFLIGGKAKQWVAFGRGDGTFSGDPKLGAGPSVAPYGCFAIESSTAVPKPCEFPLAIGNFDGAHTPTGPLAVFPSSIAWIVAMAPDASGMLQVGHVVVAIKNTGEWSVARVADLNANGLLDVVAGSKDSLDLDFFNGTTSYLFNPAKIATEQPVRNLEIGDYDGDLVSDVAMTLIDAAGPDRDGLAIAYGRFMSPPEPPFAIGTFQPIQQLMAGKIDPTNAIDNIGCISGKDGDNISVLVGGGERQLLSPYGFNEQMGSTNLAAGPTAVAVGNFDGDANLDVAAVAFDLEKDLDSSTFRLWVAPGAGGGQLAPAQIGKTLEDAKPGSADADGFSIVSVLRAADLDGDGKDEVVLFAPTKGVPQRAKIIVAKASAGPKGPELSPVFDANLGPEWAPSGASDLALTDVDGDGKLDAVVLDAGHSRAKAALVVFFGDGKGAFDPDPKTIALPDDTPRAFAVVPSSASIAIASDKAVYLVAGGGRALAPTKLEGFAGGNTIAAGDVSGDGVPDLVVGTGKRVDIHLGIARNR